jgi:Na+-driven multidrug efflux pump
VIGHLYPAQDFGNAFSIFASQNFGGKKHDRIKTGFRQALLIAYDGIDLL